MPSTSDVLVVLTADQVSSRRDGDRVPAALDALDARAVPTDRSSARSFARTAGDEIQALFESSEEVVGALRVLARLGDWRVGMGLGCVDLPVPDDVRAASGGAFVAARAAVEEARRSSVDLAMQHQGRGPATPEVLSAVARCQAALELLQLAWHRRTDAGWDVAALAERGVAQKDIARDLGISQSAVSQRLRAAAVREVQRGEELAVSLLDEARTAVAG